MKVWFGQFYIEPGASFPFSHHFQRRLSQDVTALVAPSARFIKQYGRDYGLMFNVSAKKALQNNEIRGPTVFKKTKDVEYTVYLPFDLIMSTADVPKSALTFLLGGVCEVLDSLDIDTAKLLEKQDSLIAGICSDPTMLAAPSWNEADNKTRVRVAFEAFFQTKPGT
jgi:hypothetical protein